MLKLFTSINVSKADTECAANIKKLLIYYQFVAIFKLPIL